MPGMYCSCSIQDFHPSQNKGVIFFLNFLEIYMTLHQSQRYAESDQINPEGAGTNKNFMHLCSFRSKHRALLHCSSQTQCRRGAGCRGESSANSIKKKIKLIEVLWHSLTYSQFTSGLSIKNQVRLSPPHHYCRTLQSSSATSVQHSATGR